MIYSVVIGIDSYRDPRITNLECARADAKAIAHLLEDRIESSDRDVRLLINGAATRKKIVKAIGEDLPRLQSRDDLVLIYYAGHGCPEHTFPPNRTARYLVPHDADYDRIFATGISLEQELKTLLERQSAGRVLFILDACFSGLAGGRTFIGPSLAHAVSMFRSSIPPLRSLDLGFGRVILAACRDNEVALEETRLGHGLFTYHLLACLTEAGDATIGVAELYEKLYSAVVRATGGKQQPVMKGELIGLRLPRLSS